MDAGKAWQCCPQVAESGQGENRAKPGCPIASRASGARLFTCIFHSDMRNEQMTSRIDGICEFRKGGLNDERNERG